MFVDLLPVASPMLDVASYKVAEQIARIVRPFPYSPPKVPEVWNHMLVPSHRANIYHIFTSECLIVEDLFCLIPCLALLFLYVY